VSCVSFIFVFCGTLLERSGWTNDGYLHVADSLTVDPCMLAQAVNATKQRRPDAGLQVPISLS
jgi:hypothetical protein